MSERDSLAKEGPEAMTADARRDQIRARLENSGPVIIGNWRVEAGTLKADIEWLLAELSRVEAERDALQRTRRACDCQQPDPVMQGDGKFYCHKCSFQTGARPACLEPEQQFKRAEAALASARIGETK